MAGLMQRATLIVRAKISKLLNRAENPTETLDYSYEQMQEQLQNVKRGVADVVTAKKRLELQTQKLEQNVVKLETQARQALAANREDLARQALERKSAAQQQLQGLDDQIKGLADQQEKLVAGQQQLETRIEAFRSQKEVMKAQYSAAEAQVRIGETTTGALEDFTAGDQTQLDRELAQLSSTNQVDQDLARLKAEVGAGDESKQLGAGDAEPAPGATQQQEQGQPAEQ